MSKFFLCLILFIPQLLDAQDKPVVKRITTALESKDFHVLEDTISKIPSAYWEYFRDLTNSYKEGILTFGYAIKDKDNPNMGTSYSFQVNIITNGSVIAFYNLGKISGWDDSFKSITRCKDNKAFAGFISSFDSVFHTKPDEKDLFNKDFVYGYLCGFGSTEVEGRTLVNQFVQTQQKDSLIHWLQSANTEKQIYAVDGLFQLKQKGIQITADELKIIKFVLNKKGEIHVCGGCIYTKREICEAVMKFEF